MIAPLGAREHAAERRLAVVSIFVAMASLVATVAALAELPYASAAGQWIVITGGASVSVAAFVFGLLISLRRTRARHVGFGVVGITCVIAAMFGLVALVVPESRWVFGVWTIGLLAYAALATLGLVRWPKADARDHPKSSLGLFISYRRQDSRETVGRMHDHLRQWFEDERLFLDVDRQAAGEDYRTVIVRALDRSDVLLAVIGTGWLSVTDRGGRRRLDDPEDMVRIELETAFARQLRVIPVLIEGASMPAAADLPASLQPLSYRTALPLRPDPDFRSDMERLVAALRGGD